MTSTSLTSCSKPTATPSTSSQSNYVYKYLKPLLPSIYTNTTITSFFALLLSTCTNHILAPIRDATGLSIGVAYIPRLTLASTFLALVSSVPIGWLFEAPDPSRRHLFKQLGLTRGETQGSSLALFYRMFAIFLLVFSCLEKLNEINALKKFKNGKWRENVAIMGYVLFFLVVHLMRLHSISLVWGVTSEAMEYEEAFEMRTNKNNSNNSTSSSSIIGEEKKDDVQRENDKSLLMKTSTKPSENSISTTNKTSQVRLKRLAFVGFGGTLGGIMGSTIVSFTTHALHLSGLLLLAAILLLISAHLSMELGNIMRKYWLEEQQILLLQEEQQNSNSGEFSADICLKRVSSSSSMKRISSGNSLQRVSSANSIDHNNMRKSTSENSISEHPQPTPSSATTIPCQTPNTQHNSNNSIHKIIDDDTFRQRLLRGITTILRSKLLMSIFTYNALYASTSTLLSFQRAQLVVLDQQRYHAEQKNHSTTELHTAFLAKINVLSSLSIFIFQISGVGVGIANTLGMRGTLFILPCIRLLGVIFLLLYEQSLSSHLLPTFLQENHLILFLLLDELVKIVNLAIAKPVRESLWRGLSVEARYEAKPIVDTLANRWGGGSAAFLVQCMAAATWFHNGKLLLCFAISVWWCVVSVHLGFVRMRIDAELKKRL